MSAMVAAVLGDPTGPQPLRLDSVPIPVPGPGEVLLAVGAFALNNAELLQCEGTLPAPPGAIPGLECAGVVVALGVGVHTLRTGDRVAALTRAGSYAEYVAVRADTVLPLPDDVELCVGAALPEAAATAWWNLVHRGRLRSGEQVLVHGAAGGVGSLAVQLARALGASVTGTARGPVKTALCRDLGCDSVLDYAEQDVFDAVRRRQPGGFDIILDNRGAPTLDANIGALAPGGRLVVIGVAGGSEGVLDLGALMAAGAEVSSASLSRLTDAARAAICRELRSEVLPRVRAREIWPVLDEQAFTLADIGAAHKRFGAADRIGKVVVTTTADISKSDAHQRNQLFVR
ncbi:zinc-binding dehydrogenase [Mycolicibacterium neoaurum]|uniref:zinc-binding dehydrogenase n=1 Tax=Mycolicibacterium neoaurum TaxID=1795 RepID=UPI00248D26AF|nr:zinc-binding dehydrogenase [Mycolicibacterium neoaurum]WBP97052.1 zinc-binding dehydrogenase [Mycolicibacterium neoaurum]WBS10667.1 zinc-binding dehydrogenase [Mycolicibacterium neoaurum]